MKKSLFAATIALSACFANAGSFDGPYVQLGIGGAHSSTKQNGTDHQLFDGTASQSSFNGQVAAGWSESVGPSGFNMAANMFYVIGNQNAGKPNGHTSEPWSLGALSGDYNYSGNMSSTLKNTFGISVEPGWYLEDRTLGYLKLAWLNTRVHQSGSYSTTCTQNVGTCTVVGGDVSETGSKSTNGFGYGLGAKHLITANTYIGGRSYGC